MTRITDATQAAQYVILSVAGAMFVSLLAIVVLSFRQIPVPSELSTVPGIAIAALIGLLGRTRPDPAESVPVFSAELGSKAADIGSH